MEILSKENYYEFSAVSNSSLNNLLPETGGSIKKYKYFLVHPEELEESEAIKLGKLIHLMIEKRSLDIFKVIQMPTPAIQAVCDYALEIDKGEIVRSVAVAVDKLEYQKSWKMDTRVTKIMNDGFDYMNSIKEAKEKGLTLVSQQDYSKLQNIYDSINETYPYILDKDRVIANELPILFNWNDIPCKALIDMIVVNHSEKTVTIIDLKTTTIPISIYTGYLEIEKHDDAFASVVVPGTYLKRYVHRQLAFYKRAASQYLEEKFPGYFVGAAILAVETKAPYECYLKYLTEDELKLGERLAQRGIDYLKHYKLAGSDL